MPYLLQHNPSQQRLRQDLAEIRKEMEEQTLDIAEAFLQYGNSVDYYYTQNPPFGSKILEQDCSDFVELVGHSVVIGNYYLLSKWGVSYPLNNPSVLIALPEDYIGIFEQAITTDWEHNKQVYGWPNQSMEYWNYLIAEWKKCLT